MVVTVCVGGVGVVGGGGAACAANTHTRQPKLPQSRLDDLTKLMRKSAVQEPAKDFNRMIMMFARECARGVGVAWVGGWLAGVLGGWVGGWGGGGERLFVVSASATFYFVCEQRYVLLECNVF